MVASEVPRRRSAALRAAAPELRRCRPRLLVPAPAPPSRPPCSAQPRRAGVRTAPPGPALRARLRRVTAEERSKVCEPGYQEARGARSSRRATLGAGCNSQRRRAQPGFSWEQAERAQARRLPGPATRGGSRARAGLGPASARSRSESGPG